MEIVKPAVAGTLESSDLMVKVAPAPDGRLEIVIASEVMQQFGRRIREVAEETLGKLGVAARRDRDRRQGGARLRHPRPHSGRGPARRAMPRARLEHARMKLRRSMLFLPGANAGDAQHGFRLQARTRSCSTWRTRCRCARRIRRGCWSFTPCDCRSTATSRRWCASTRCRRRSGWRTWKRWCGRASTWCACRRPTPPRTCTRWRREVERIERACGRAVGSTGLMAAIESALGVVNALAIARASARMIGIALAGFDYVMDMQTERGDGSELFYARCAVLHAARAARIDAFDVVFPDVNDDAGFLKEVELIKRLGFNGKSLINPRQIELLHNAFAPTEEEVDYAQPRRRRRRGRRAQGARRGVAERQDDRSADRQARPPCAAPGRGIGVPQVERKRGRVRSQSPRLGDAGHRAVWRGSAVSPKHALPAEPARSVDASSCPSLEDAIRASGLRDGMTFRSIMPSARATRRSTWWSNAGPHGLQGPHGWRRRRCCPATRRSSSTSEAGSSAASTPRACAASWRMPSRTG